MIPADNFQSPKLDTGLNDSVESIIFFSNCVMSPCGYKQETSRSGFPWWSRWSPRVPGSARPPGTTAGRTKTPACLPTPGTTSEVSLWCQHAALASQWAIVRRHVFRLLAVGDTWWMSQRRHHLKMRFSTFNCQELLVSTISLVITCDSKFVFVVLLVSVLQHALLLMHIGWDSMHDSAAGCGEICVLLIICYFCFDSSAL